MLRADGYVMFTFILGCSAATATVSSPSPRCRREAARSRRQRSDLRRRPGQGFIPMRRVGWEEQERQDQAEEFSRRTRSRGGTSGWRTLSESSVADKVHGKDCGTTAGGRSRRCRTFTLGNLCSNVDAPRRTWRAYLPKRGWRCGGRTFFMLCDNVHLVDGKCGSDLDETQSRRYRSRACDSLCSNAHFARRVSETTRQAHGTCMHHGWKGGGMHGKGPWGRRNGWGGGWMQRGGERRGDGRGCMHAMSFRSSHTSCSRDWHNTLRVRGGHHRHTWRHSCTVLRPCLTLLVDNIGERVTRCPGPTCRVGGPGLGVSQTMHDELSDGADGDVFGRSRAAEMRATKPLHPPRSTARLAAIGSSAAELQGAVTQVAAGTVDDAPWSAARRPTRPLWDQFDDETEGSEFGERACSGGETGSSGDRGRRCGDADVGGTRGNGWGPGGPMGNGVLGCFSGGRVKPSDLGPRLHGRQRRRGRRGGRCCGCHAALPRGGRRGDSRPADCGHRRRRRPSARDGVQDPRAQHRQGELPVRQWAPCGKPLIRIGEATNPGPGPDGSRKVARKCVWGAFAAQQPHVAGFRHAWAPGFDGEVDEDAVDGLDKDHFELQVETVNVTGWKTLAKYQRRTTADILLVQELRVGPDKVDEKVAWLRRRAWNAIIAPAVPGPNGGWCGGVAVLARPHVGMSFPRVGSETIVEARAVAAWLEPPGSRPFLATSCYLQDGKGMAASNLEILKTIGKAVAAQGEACPFIIGGDMQATPQELAATGFAGTAEAVIAASLHPAGTCRTATTARELDYFVVSKGLAVGIQKVAVVPRSGVKTHSPVALQFKPCLTSIRALVIRQPPRLSTERIIGPVRKVADWRVLAEKARKLASEAAVESTDADVIHHSLGQLYTEWADLAEKELAECVYGGMDLPKYGTRGRPPVLVWRSILPERNGSNDDDQATLWRNVANAALGLQRLAIDAMQLLRPPPGGDDERDDDGGRGADGLPGDDEVAQQCRHTRGRARGDGNEVWEIDWESWSAQLEDTHRDAIELRRELLDAIADCRWGQCATDESSCEVETVDLLVRTLSELRANMTIDDATREVIQKVRANVAERADTIAERLRQKHEADWAAWLRKGIEAGARNAHRYLRLPEQWRPQPMVSPDGVLSSDPAKMTAAYRKKYLERWNGQAGEDAAAVPRTSAPWMTSARCALPKPTVDELRGASRGFSHGTAVAFDGFSMRHYALVSDEGLGVLSDLVVVMELVGRPPPQTEALVLPLIGKARGGHRVVTTATSLYRLWGRLRREYSQRWEAANDRPYFAAGKGRRVQDVVWRQSARAEAGAGAARTSAAALWDMAVFFDSINRVRLWRMIIKHGFPLPVARVAFAMYDAPRVISLEGRLSCPAFGRNGVLPGCPFAMALTRVFSLDPFDAFVEQLTLEVGDEVLYDSYVDDLVLAVDAPEGQAADLLVDAAKLLAEQIVDVMGCQIEAEKASIVSSSPKVAKEVARRLGSLGGSGGGQRAAVNLGCDFAPGQARRFQGLAGKRQGRHRVLRKRARRLAAIKKLVGGGRNARKLFVTGLLAAAVPDAAVNGVSDSEALHLRRAAALACSPRARGRSLAMVSLINDLPTWRAEVEVILQYARQVWAAGLQGARKQANGALSLSQLAGIWREVDKDSILEDGPDVVAGRRRGGGGRRGAVRDEDDQRRRLQGGGGSRRPADAMWRSDGRRRRWDIVKGPIGAAILSLHRVGWSMPSPFVLRDDWGEDVPLTKVTPAMLATMLKDATIRAIETYVGGSMAKTDTSFEGRRACTEHIRRQLASDKRITPQGRGAYLSVLCGAIMTRSKAAALGYLVIDECPKCKAKGDTVRHRVYECQHPDVVAARQGVMPEWLRAEASRRPREEQLWVTGLIPHPGDRWPRPIAEANPVVEFVGEGPRPLCEATGIPKIGPSVYVDGSCTAHTISELKRAATAAIVQDEAGRTEWRIGLAVPSPMPQTSQAAEFVAMPLLHAYLPAAAAAITMASDCLNVVRACSSTVRAAIDDRKLYGGLVKQVRADPEWERRVTVRKVPAHVDPRTCATPEAVRDAIGNGLADEHAKLAVGMHPQPSPAQVQDLEASLRRSRIIVRAIAAIMPHFPPMPRERMVRRPAARTGAVINGEGGHVWRFAAGCWRCDVCWALTVKSEIDAALAHRRCNGPKLSLSAAEVTARGHKLAYAEGHLPLLFCLDCGAFSARRAYGLGTACRGVPTGAGRQALARIKRGQQPWSTRHDRGAPRRGLGMVAAWSGARSAFIDAGGEMYDPGGPERMDADACHGLAGGGHYD